MAAPTKMANASTSCYYCTQGNLLNCNITQTGQRPCNNCHNAQNNHPALGRFDNAVNARCVAPTEAATIGRDVDLPRHEGVGSHPADTKQDSRFDMRSMLERIEHIIRPASETQQPSTNIGDDRRQEDIQRIHELEQQLRDQSAQHERALQKLQQDISAASGEVTFRLFQQGVALGYQRAAAVAEADANGFLERGVAHGAEPQYNAGNHFQQNNNGPRNQTAGAYGPPNQWAGAYAPPNQAAYRDPPVQRAHQPPPPHTYNTNPPAQPAYYGPPPNSTYGGQPNTAPNPRPGQPQYPGYGAPGWPRPGR